jgi:hypothetical protein
MGWRHLHGRADVNYNDPQPFAICQRCGIQYNLEDLQWQWAIVGTDLNNTGLLVCRFCVDDLPTFTVPQILPPDPEPVFNARPEAYAIDEDDFRITQDDQQRITQEDDFRIVQGSSAFGEADQIFLHFDSTNFTFDSSLHTMDEAG